MLGNMDGGSFTGNVEGKLQKEVLETGVSRPREPVGKPGEPIDWEF
jgi:hypothetical protein